MKTFVTAAALIAIATLTACTPGANQAQPGGAQSAPPATASTTPAPVTSTTPAPTAGAPGLEASCEQFNILMADYGAAKGSTADAYDDIYLRADTAAAAAPADTQGLLRAVKVLALDKAAAGIAGDASQGAKDGVRDAMFAAAGACTAVGVTLKV